MNAHVLGFPRMGINRELKWALESFWRGETTETALIAIAEDIKKRHWEIQAKAGMDLLPVGDFSLYDHVLDTIAQLGAVPPRFQREGSGVDLQTYFHMARGHAENGIPAMEMTKWFDSNYHYIVPELTPDMRFEKSNSRLLEDALAARELGYSPKPVLVGPVTFLMLAKEVGTCNRWDHLESITNVYCEIIAELDAHCSWIQIDEPILCTDLTEEARQAFRLSYTKLKSAALSARLLLTTYFGELDDNLDLALSLPVNGLHVDLVRGRRQLERILDTLPPHMTLSLGLVDGRNVWKTELETALRKVNAASQKVKTNQIMIGSSCSLLHSPMDASNETELAPELKQWMAFAVQKCDEINALKQAAITNEKPALFNENTMSLLARGAHADVVDKQTRSRVQAVTPRMYERTSPFAVRSVVQKERLKLPLFPTTTIGSFPQTAEIRKARLQYKQGQLSAAEYTKTMKAQISEVVDRQEALGLDVLVHGEPERNDMVEYFGQQLRGFCFTSNGWVQSYGSRCVKPPIIYGDVSRPEAMTVDWAVYAQSLTDRPMKGMLTGPVTILCWSFVRNDLPREDVCRQIGLAIRDEVVDLEAAGINIIQIDEAALREGMPIRKDQQEAYLRWAVDCFRLAAGGVADATQIHSHMCYSEFNVIMRSIAEMDADVISIEASRSGMELLDAFNAYQYPAEIGPGVYDIHSPRIPDTDEIYSLLTKALKVIPAERLWVNPDCGLKTRAWPETTASLGNMVRAAARLRREYA
ncbi:MULTISPECIES: 5-methyltetrahydropteroyltriglutamate--homocysteine S-methyltransferase [unclassified Pseudodesulfovibrio]|uniref:5-methyltetrahydropteroyltriglutamate-- homocysteine S-methyltransferase n=1 Tax=unclassified Pseudodesulfovibrio TaxID=2661612 RepID=UPI000FEBABAB|nr:MULTISPECIES: 5-methyltetrahydropteroyltriglutamate--homocysteine S-methyltransferase [unclassified Pseudodesulfovibrio]MCJ2164738.1 5-methyltetrahydropteroyltriglutamate--homocysteine S-methyltransferase [Pseudodesulfovibrio sp. S3-i]RWU04074.1 5-methyltetrahydropteroyltriglutamate--homocysteine S-methyltransferase [Pseudodesulfovibrio sp. S3]